MDSAALNAIRVNSLSGVEAKVARRLLEITIGHTTTISGIVVTRWSAEMWEVETYGKCQEKVDEAAISLVEAAHT